MTISNDEFTGLQREALAHLLGLSPEEVQLVVNAAVIAMNDNSDLANVLRVTWTRKEKGDVA